MWHCKRFPSKVWLVIPLLSLVLLAVACGPSVEGTATPAPIAAPQPAAPVAAPAPAPTPTLVGVPKAVPTPTPILVPPAKVHPGKLTIMMGDLGNERFDSTFVVGSTPTNNYMRLLHGFLISTNERTELIPGIASHWGLSADGLTWTVTIKKGVRWHDGSGLTPEDVLWTLQHRIGPQAYEYTVGGRVSRNMERIELSGPDKVSLTTKTPAPELAGAELSETSSASPHITPKRTKLRDTAEEVAYDNNPIGAGFMRLVKHVPGYVMKLERFDDYYYQPKNGFPEDKRVNFQYLDLFLAPEEATRVAAVRAGEADLVPVSLATKKQVEAGGGRLVFAQEGGVVQVWIHRCWDQPPTPCRDKRVRQALQYALNKELMRDRLYGGPEVFQVKGWDLVTPSTIGYTPELDPWPFDPNKARQLLSDAGYPGGKGLGKLIVNTAPSVALPFMVEGAQLAADFWRRELGLDVEVKVVDFTALKKARLTGELRGQIAWQNQETRQDASNWVYSTHGDLAQPYGVHHDPEVSRLVQETLQILDPDKRAAASKKLYLRLRDESYLFGIGYLNIPWGVGPRVLTWRPYPLALYPSALHTITLK